MIIQVVGGNLPLMFNHLPPLNESPGVSANYVPNHLNLYLLLAYVISHIRNSMNLLLDIRGPGAYSHISLLQLSRCLKGGLQFNWAIIKWCHHALKWFHTIVVMYMCSNYYYYFCGQLCIFINYIKMQFLLRADKSLKTMFFRLIFEIKFVLIKYNFCSHGFTLTCFNMCIFLLLLL